MKTALITACAATPIAFLTGDLYASNLRSMPGNPIGNLADAIPTIPAYIAGGGTPTTAPIAICAGLLLVCAVWLAYARYLVNSGDRRAGEEHGSARWATRKEMKMFEDASDTDNNIILTRNCQVALAPREFSQKTDRNRNVEIIGGSGSGKTRYHVKPELMQMNASYFVTDPKGTLIGDMGHMFADAGYEIRQFSTIDFAQSNRYNPIEYVRTQADILTFVECLIRNTTGDKDHTGDPFWENAERLLYTALIAYLIDHCPKENRNIPGLLTLLALAEAREEDESYLSPLDMLFDEIETGRRYVNVSGTEPFDRERRTFDGGGGSYRWISTGDPIAPDDDFGLSNYRAFKTAAGKTLKSIIISCNVRLKPLSIKEVRELLAFDEMDLDHLGDENRRYVVFASMSDTNSTFDFLFAILMWQTLDVLCSTALRRYGGQLPTHVTFIFDEFANAGHIPDFDKTIAVVRSRNISCEVILQSSGQLAASYDKEKAQVIRDNCDITLFLGGKSTETDEEISKAIGKQTLSTLTVNDTRGSHSSSTRNYNTAERDLMQASEVGRLPRDEAIVLIAGANPVRDRKYRLEDHPRYESVDPGHPGARYGQRFDFGDYRNTGKGGGDAS